MQFLRSALRTHQAMPAPAPTRVGMATVPLRSTPLKDIPEIVATARSAFNQGKTLSAAQRKDTLKGLFGLLDENEELFYEALRHDLMKPRFEMRFTEIELVKGEIATALRELDHWVKPRHVSKKIINAADKLMLVPQPKGVVLIISAWNYPVQLLISPAVGAVAAGNAVVFKPSDVSPATSNTLMDLLPKYVDSECFPVVAGEADVARKLLEQRFDHILYTGNGAVGKEVMRAAANHLTPVTLELGGKSPVVVSKDNNMHHVAKRILFGKMTNLGQTCIAPDYILVEREAQDELIAQLKRVLKESFGEDPKTSPHLGRIVAERHVKRMAGYLEEQGLDIVLGGKYDVAERWIEPTIIKDPPPTSRVMTDEIFGPILPIIGIDSIDEAVQFINSRDKPLALYVFGKKPVVDKLIVETAAGGVCANDTVMHFAVHSLPFGGIGPSGMGAYHGHHTFEVFSHMKPVMIRPQGLEIANLPRYAPLTPAKFNVLKRIVPRVTDNFIMRMLR
eukprot:comp23434_c1_seq1/m.39018 comp23434_c1_seq1/g.39018  ORF comp23434_c1_seq1/g.39018 comp23434_c1_seq1/m.39018 type:complete len:506 (-) comp23434_c1_seq1:166-1683(-)